MSVTFSAPDLINARGQVGGFEPHLSRKHRRRARQTPGMADRRGDVGGGCGIDVRHLFGPVTFSALFSDVLETIKTLLRAAWSGKQPLIGIDTS